MAITGKGTAAAGMSNTGPNDGTTITHGSSIEAESCPVCKADRYLNPSLVIVVSPCFHKMCTSCVNRIFGSGPASCPMCKTMLRKKDFVKQTFENLRVEKEVQVRKRIARIYNQPPQHFPSLRAYNDYLEGVEEIVHFLVYGIRVPETEAAIEAYKEAHKEEIAANLARKVKEDREFVRAQEQEKREKLLRREAFIKQALLEAKALEEQKELTIQQLAEKSTKSAKDIIQDSMKEDVRKSVPSAAELYKSATGDDDHAMDTSVSPEDLIMPEHVIYEDAGLYYQLMDNYTDPWTLPFKPAFVVSSSMTGQQEISVESHRARAGGFAPKFIYERSLKAAFSGIFV